MTNLQYINRDKIVIIKSLIVITYDFTYYLGFRSCFRIIMTHKGGSRPKQVN